MRSPTLRPEAAFALALAAAVGATWAPSLDASFQFDDWRVIVDNPHVRTLSAWWASMPGMRALTKLSYALDQARGGQAATFRATSVILHAVNAVLTFLVFRTVGARRAGPAPAAPHGVAAATAAVVFALHPVQTESVTYLAARPNELAATGALVALLAWQRQFGSPRPGRWSLAALVALAAGLAGKETAAVTPVAMALLAAAAPGGFRRESASSLVAPALLVVAAVAAGLAFLPYGGLLRTSLSIRGPLDNLVAQVGSLGTLASHLVLWGQLNADPAPAARTALDGATMAGFVLLAGGLAGALLALRRHPAPAFGVLWTYLWLAPTNSFLARFDPLNDRQWYLAIAGPGWLLGLALARLPPRGAAASVVTLALALAAGTLERNRVYATETSFWSDVAGKSPGNARAWNNLGIALARDCRPEAAAAAFAHAAALAPDDTVPAVNEALVTRGELPDLPARCRGARTSDGAR
jgi:hypothetical protein